MWAVFAKAAEIVNYLKTNVGTNADAASASGSVHAKLKDIKATIAAQPVGVIQSIQRGTTTITVNSLDVTIASVNIAKATINVQHWAGTSGGGNELVYAQLINSTTLRLKRVFTTRETEIHWEVVEYV